MKFQKQFEINKLYVGTKFRGNESHDFGFRTQKPIGKFDVKSGLIQKRQKIFHKVIFCLKTFFHPHQPTFGHDDFFLFFLSKPCVLFF